MVGVSPDSRILLYSSCSSESDYSTVYNSTVFALRISVHFRSSTLMFQSDHMILMIQDADFIKSIIQDLGRNRCLMSKGINSRNTEFENTQYDYILEFCLGKVAPLVYLAAQNSIHWST